MRRNVIRYESHDRSRSAVPEIYFIYKKQYYVPFYFANEKIFYAEDRAKMDRELNLFVLWEIGFLAWQIGHGQHDAVMAFITIISRVNFDPRM